MGARAAIHCIPETVARRIARSLVLPGGVEPFFDEGGRYLGLSTAHADGGFYPRGTGEA